MITDMKNHSIYVLPIDVGVVYEIFAKQTRDSVCLCVDLQNESSER